LKTIDYIRDKIERLPSGYVFTYVDFTTEVNKKETIIKSLNRMVASGKIAKLSKGKFYKPENTPFGTLLPDQKQIVKDLLEKEGRVIIGYLTGYSVYNQLGLSTQVSNIIQIGCANVRPATKRGQYKIVFVKQKNTITKENIPLLQILDAIKNIKKIPDASVVQSCKRFVAIIKELSKEQNKMLIKLALKYPPSTRALLGAFIDQVKTELDTSMLLKSLNPITKYKIGLGDSDLLNAQKWNLV